MRLGATATERINAVYAAAEREDLEEVTAMTKRYARYYAPQLPYKPSYARTVQRELDEVDAEIAARLQESSMDRFRREDAERQRRELFGAGVEKI